MHWVDDERQALPYSACMHAILCDAFRDLMGHEHAHGVQRAFPFAPAHDQGAAAQQLSTPVHRRE